MSNAYFQFRQFTIQQDRCVMKVCTDSCVLGAWAARRLGAAERVLDIGAGTGLLSLMLAQKTQAAIDAIELDPEAARQATENIAASPWFSRIRLINEDILQYSPGPVYDFIISNPPFYEGELLSLSPEKNRARHAKTLSLDQLIQRIQGLLKPDAAFCLLIPFHRTGYMEKLALIKGYQVQHKLLIRQSPAHAPFRSVLLFALQEADFREPEELIVRDGEGRETPELLKLMKDYYLR